MNRSKQDNSVPDVTVLDINRRFLGYTRRGKARKLVSTGKAKWLQKEPPILTYIAKSPKKITYRRKEIMGKTITNWTEFFKEPRDIYAQNVSNCQVSVEFETAPGYKTGFLFIQSRDPVNLTQFIPFEAIKSSVDFRKMLNRRPPAIALLTEEEFMEYYERKAKMYEVDTEKAIDMAAERLQRVHNKQDYTTDRKPDPIHKVVEDDGHFGGKKRVESTDIMAEDEIIHPKVLHLCNQVQPNVENKMKAFAMLEEIEAISSGLKLDDWQYIQSHGYWKTVKNFARTQILKLSNSSTSREDEGAVEETFASM